MSEDKREYWRNQAAHDELAWEIENKARELKNRIESVHEEIVTYEEFEDLRCELLERQNRMFRVFARELRSLRNHWHFQDADYGVIGEPQE